MSRPCARSSAASAVTAMVGDGFTRCTRCETARLTAGLPSIPAPVETAENTSGNWPLNQYGPAQPCSMDRLRAGIGLFPGGRPATGDRRAGRRARVRPRAADPAGSNGFGQDVQHGGTSFNPCSARRWYWRRTRPWRPSCMARCASFSRNNRVEYFVSYYDYYQPEAYVPSSDTYIEKDAAVNAHIEQMRLSATKALLERHDAVIVATVSVDLRSRGPGGLLQHGAAPVARRPHRPARPVAAPG